MMDPLYLLLPIIGAFVMLFLVCCFGRKMKEMFHIPKEVIIPSRHYTHSYSFDPGGTDTNVDSGNHDLTSSSVDVNRNSSRLANFQKPSTVCSIEETECLVGGQDTLPKKTSFNRYEFLSLEGQASGSSDLSNLNQEVYMSEGIFLEAPPSSVEHQERSRHQSSGQPSLLQDQDSGYGVENISLDGSVPCDNGLATAGSAESPEYVGKSNQLQVDVHIDMDVYMDNTNATQVESENETQAQ